MMFHFPNFGMPYYNRYSRYGYRLPPYTYHGLTNKNFENNSKKTSNLNNNSYSSKNNIHHQNLNSHSNPNSNSHDKNNISSTSSSNDNASSSIEQDTPMFQLFGINLYFDDILLICLIFFLYQEGVKDESLFIALILLLLS